MLDTSGCAPSRYVDTGLTVRDLETRLGWQKKTLCPAGYESDDATYETVFTTGDVTMTVDASGTTWTGTATDSIAGGPHDCAGTVTGTTFTGSCPALTVTINGTIDCSALTLDFNIIGGANSGSGSGTIMASPAHDGDKTFTWSTGSPWDPTGTVFTDFLAALNGGVTGAGDCTSADAAGSPPSCACDGAGWLGRRANGARALA